MSEVTTEHGTISAENPEPYWLRTNRELSKKIRTAHAKKMENPTPCSEAGFLTDKMLHTFAPDEYVAYRDHYNTDTATLIRKILIHTPDHDDFHTRQMDELCVDECGRKYGVRYTGGQSNLFPDENPAQDVREWPNSNANVSIYVDEATIAVSVSPLEEKSSSSHP